jgi:hypothetical protein
MRIAFIVAAVLLGACSDAKKSFDDGFKLQFEKSFIESCVDGARKAGAPEERMPKVNELCACTAKTLLTKHSTTELASMGAGGNQEAIQAAAQGCMQ